MQHRIGWMRKTALAIGAGCLAAVFVLFLLGIGMRDRANRPLSWIDEAVTILSVWGTFWTAACVLRWPEFIAFDVLFNGLSPARQRLCLAVGAGSFIVLIGAALPGMVDSTLFLWRERTDAMQLRIDVVYSIFPFFLSVLLVRLCLTVRALIGPDWQRELSRWTGAPQP